MSCILRINGERLDIDAILETTSLKPDRIWRRGEPRIRSKPEEGVHTDSGLTFLVSDADFSEFDRQVESATTFMETYRDDIILISKLDFTEYATLDFGVGRRDVMVHCDYLPPKFLNAIAGTGVGVEISHYPCKDVN